MTVLKARVVLAAVFLSLLLTISPAIGFGPNESPRAYVYVDGQRLEAFAGRLLKQGVVDQARGECSEADHSIEISLPPHIGYASVGVGVDETCALKVLEVVFERQGRSPDGRRLPAREPAGSSLGAVLSPFFSAEATSLHEIWGRHRMEEQFHVTTTLVHQGFRYYHSGNDVLSPVAVAEYCSTPGFNWTTLGCAWGTSQSGPSVVQRWTTGDFENAWSSLRHNLGARPSATASNVNMSCDGIGATMPWGWHDHCEIGIVQ